MGRVERFDSCPISWRPILTPFLNLFGSLDKSQKAWDPSCHVTLHHHNDRTYRTNINRQPLAQKGQETQPLKKIKLRHCESAGSENWVRPGTWWQKPGDPHLFCPGLFMNLYIYLFILQFHSKGWKKRKQWRNNGEKKHNSKRFNFTFRGKHFEIGLCSSVP